MATEQVNYTVSRETNLSFEEAADKARALLQEAGYGILCGIDVQTKLKEKLGIEREPYLILGACNPPLANESLKAEPDLGALLPCNVVLVEKAARTWLQCEPERMLSIVGNEQLKPIAEQVCENLSRVVEELAKG